MIIFLIRRYNDVDHILPIVYRMVKDGFLDLEVCSINPRLDLRNDFRCKFLREQFNVSIKHAHSAYLPTIVHKVLAFVGWWCSQPSFPHTRITKLNWFFGIVWKLVRQYCFPWINEFLIKKIYFGDKWATRMFKHKDVSVLVLDKQNLNRYPVCCFVTATKMFGIPLVGVPHGLSLPSGDNWSWGERKSAVGVAEQLRDYDAYIVPHEEYKKVIVSGGANPQKIHVFGSARFCNEWRSIYLDLVPEAKNLPSDSSKVKLVFMDHSFQFRMYPDVILNTIRRLAKLEFLEIIVKPSTSTQESAKGGISTDEFINLVPVDYDTPSVELVRWADAVMGVTSSILLEALFMDKPLIYPKYFHDNTLLLETMESCWIINSDDELEKALRQIKEVPHVKPYSAQNVNRFLETTVYGGKPNRDVLGDYVRFILSVDEQNTH